MYLKLNLWPKIGLIRAVSVVKRFFFFFFFFFLSKKYFFLLFMLNLNYYVSQQYSENLRNIEQAELVEKLPPSYLPYRFLQTLHSFLLWEKMKIFDF